ncbi:rhodanese-like domain-containing protein [Carboxylicivirga sediminis]|uniref:Rhodanese-like domain-containing protein n=1 Tax=Carboxylicivirga sediminis TaxID=2006564 RepID=A0A941F7I0_9BACT|nr:rhodanese-like domain-containing protein [Carboxylicivirga sediminis]MBR8538188.1 rhodanese-like domain-containing protein [Carboxylicivirga sediminis]
MRKAFILIFLLLGASISLMAQDSKRVTAKEFYALIQQHPDALIVDVRPAGMFAKYRLQNAMPAPEKADLIELTKVVPKSDTIFLYCEKDIRTRPAAEILQGLGYTNIIELKGGLVSWRRYELPLDEEKLK